MVEEANLTWLPSPSAGEGLGVRGMRFVGRTSQETTMRRTLIIGTLAIFTLAAGPPNARPWTDAVQAAIGASEQGNSPAAEQLLKGTLEFSTDPGLVAFNLGVLAFERKDWVEAERNFTCSLDDAEAPEERRAKSHYNRAICLLHRGGLAECRAAIDGLERCLAATPEGNLRSDARHNLELAKLLWAEASANSKQSPKPNDPPPNAPPEPEKKPGKPKTNDPANPEQNDNGTKTGQPQTADPAQQPPKPGSKPKATEKTTGGKGNLPVRIDPATWRPADEVEAKEFLAKLSRRLAKDRRGSAEVHAPPERADVKDW